MYILKFHKFNQISKMKIGSKEALIEWVKYHDDGFLHFQEKEDVIYIKDHSKEIGIIQKIEEIK